MSRASSNILILLAAGCGVMTAYATFQPEFEKQAAERKGDFTNQHTSENRRPVQDGKVLSRAIASDFKEAGEQLRDTSKGGFAWGLRQMIAGKKVQEPSDQESQQPKADSDAKH